MLKPAVHMPITTHTHRVHSSPHEQAVSTGQPTDHVVLVWKPEQETLLHVVPLQGGPVRTLTAPCYFTFHYMNAYETGALLHAPSRQCLQSQPANLQRKPAAATCCLVV